MSVVNELVYISLVNGKTEDFNSYYTEDYKEFLDKYLSKMIIGFYSRYALALLMESDEKKSEDIKKEFYRYSKKYIFTGSIKDAKNKIETVDQLYYK